MPNRRRLGRASLAPVGLWLLGSFASPLAAQETPPSWSFAQNYSQSRLLSSESEAQRFVEQFFDGEAAFFQAARHPQSGLTYDGWDLEPDSRKPGKPRLFSAASKECLDLALLVKALRGDPLVSRLFSQPAPAQAADILARKIRSYRAYRSAYPGFAGYLAWFESGPQARPMKGWTHAFPTLDLGEMLWALLLAEDALRETGHLATAEQYRIFNSELRASARKAMFHAGRVGVRGRVEVSDPLSPLATYSGEGLMTGEHGVHEGQMIVLYMSLYGGLSPQESDQVWADIAMRRVEHEDGSTWQGFWGSPHEQWAYLFLPYRDLPEYRQLFRIREMIRTRNAARRGYPGLCASAHHPLGKGYMSAAGIEGVGSQPLEYQDTYTPYGAFPLLLEFSGQSAGNVGLAWLQNMLAGPGMQGPFGAGESGDNAGTGTPPIKTIDASFTTLLALVGGLEKETAAMLERDGKYQQFLDLMKGEYDEAFGDAPLREPDGFGLPGGPAGQPR